MDSSHRIKKITNRGIGIQRVDDIRNIFTHIDLRIPRTVNNALRPVIEVCRENFIEQALLIGGIDFITARRKKSERGENEHAARALFL